MPKEPAFLRRVTYLCCLTDTQCSEMVSMLVRAGAPQAPPTKCEARGGPASCSYRVQQASPRPQQQRRRQRPCGRRHLAAAAAATAGAEAAAAASSYDGLLRWCIEQHQLPPLAVEPAALDGGFGMERPGFVASREVAQGEVVLQVPGDLAITAVDVDKDPKLAALAQGHSELVGLALWLLQERSKVRVCGGLAGWVLAGCWLGAGWVLAGCGNCWALAAVGWGCCFAALQTLVCWLGRKQLQRLPLSLTACLQRAGASLRMERLHADAAAGHPVASAVAGRGAGADAAWLAGAAGAVQQQAAR